jgi:hypothetical protein
VVQTISNPDGTVSIVHVDPNNPVITLPDGTQAQVGWRELTNVNNLHKNSDVSEGGALDPKLCISNPDPTF